MGGQMSALLPDLPNKDFFCIAIYGWDGLLLLYPDQPEIGAVRQAILSNWHSGIQREKFKLEKCFHFKLSGRPFQVTGGKGESIQVRLMVAAMLKSLYDLGWKHLVSSDLSRLHDLNTWFFQRQVLPQNPYQMISIGLSNFDKLQMNDVPEDLLVLIKDICERHWVNGIQNKHRMGNGRTYEIKLYGTPWRFVSKVESCSSRQLLKNIIQSLSGRNYDLYANSNLKGTADTLFFNYNQFSQGESEIFFISLNRQDRLRVIKAPGGINEAIKVAVEQHWPRGLQDVKDDSNCYELKLKGTPWWADGQDAIWSRYLMLKIMETMASLGFYVMTGLDVSRKLNDKSVFLFKRGVPLQASFLCISLNETDKIRFINAPQNVVEAARSIVHQWPLGLSNEKTRLNGVAYQAKMNGYPWHGMLNLYGIHGRALLLRLLCQFTALNWRLVCSADVSAKYHSSDKGPSYPLDIHSWYFMYDPSLSQPTYDPPPPYSFN